MSSIVTQLQNEAINSDIDLSQLLRKSYVVAKKLEIVEFERWINFELRGYDSADNVPEYREVHGSLKFKNPYVKSGYADYIIEIEEIHNLATTRLLFQPISELEDLYKKSEFIIYIEIDPASRKLFKEHFKEDIVPDVLAISVSQLKRIFDSVRNIILEWSLKLEKDGILGEELVFTNKEQEIAKENTVTYNMLIQGSQVQLGNENTQFIDNINLDEIKELLKSIADVLNDLKLDSVDKNELNVGLKTLELQVESKNPNQSIIRESLNSIRSILEGCASNAIAPVLITAITKIIGL